MWSYEIVTQVLQSVINGIPDIRYLVARFLQTVARLLLDIAPRLQFSSDFYRTHDCI